MTIALPPQSGLIGPRRSWRGIIVKTTMIAALIFIIIMIGATALVLHNIRFQSDAYVRRLNGARAINRLSQDHPTVAHLWRQGRPQDWRRREPEIIEFGESGSR